MDDVAPATESAADLATAIAAQETAAAASAEEAGTAGSQSVSATAAEPSSNQPGAASAAALEHDNSSLRLVALPPGWEGLSIKLQGDRCVVAEVPKACFSSGAFQKNGARPQVEGVAEGDEVVTLNGETPLQLMERITTAGDPLNACSSASPPHKVGSKTKFDIPPCVACDFVRRRRQLGFDVAMPMWLRAVKRDIKIILGVRSGTAGSVCDSGDKAASLLNTVRLKCEESLGIPSEAPARLDGELGSSSVVELKASKESVSKMENALERIKRLAALDDQTRDKEKKKKSRAGGQEKTGARGKVPTGPNLPRTRLTPELVTGEVKEWKGKYGWIMPHTPVDHPKAGAHRGRLYVHVVDLEDWVKSLKPGSLCRFHIYSDANSLGAEECTELKDVSSADDGDSAEWAGDSWRSNAGEDGDASAHAPGGAARSRSPRSNRPKKSE